MRTTAPILIVCVSGLLVFTSGCRDDLIDATPLHAVETEDAAPTVDSASNSPGEALDAWPDGADSTMEEAQPESTPDVLPPEREPFEQAPVTEIPAPAPRTSAPPAGRGDGEADEAPSQTAETPSRSQLRRERDGGFEGASPPGDGDARRHDGRGGLFERHDADGDGLLSAEELPEPIRERIMAADADGDGALSPDELRAAARGFRQREDVSSEARRARMLERLDANGDGKLHVQELPDRMRERLAGADADGDGILSEEEMQQGRSGWRGSRGGGPGGQETDGEQ